MLDILLYKRVGYSGSQSNIYTPLIFHVNINISPVFGTDSNFNLKKKRISPNETHSTKDIYFQ